MADAVANTGPERWAQFSADGEHRLVLGRRWSDGPLVAFVGLNPSTADAEQDDPTVRRCVGFARDWGFGGVVIANLFTYCTPDPRLLASASDRLALGADNALRDVADAATLVIEAWGAHAAAAERAEHVRALLAARTTRAVLGLTRDGAPRHPLYAPALTTPMLVSGGVDGPLRLVAAAPLPSSKSAAGQSPVSSASSLERSRSSPERIIWP